MPRTLFDALDRLLEQHRWEDAATELARLEGGDGATDVRLLRGYRRLEEGRGSRHALATHVSRFIARAPDSRALPLVRIEKGIALLLSPVTWVQHLVWLVPALYLIVMDSRSKNGLSFPVKFAMALYVLLAVVLNYELLGRKNFSLFLTIHPFAIGMLLLLGILLFDRSHAKAGYYSASEQGNRVIVPEPKIQ